MGAVIALPPLFASTPDTEEGRAEDPLYRATRDHETKIPVRDALAKARRMYGRLMPEKPEQFVREFRRDFHARSWELYVLRWLARMGAKLIKAPGHGPDFCAEHPRFGRFWVECVVPTAGKDENRVWQRTNERTWNGPPDEPIQLRYTSAIQAKIAKVASYRKKGLVPLAEPVLVAMNQGAILDSDLNDLEMPLAFKVLYGVGQLVMTVEVGSGDTDFIVQPQPALKNAKGSLVSTSIFTEESSNVVAGLILARASTINLFGPRQRLLRLAHNPLACAAVPVGVLPVRGELWVEGGHLVHRGVIGSHGRFSTRSRRRPATATRTSW